MSAARVPVAWHFDTVVVDSSTHCVLVKGVPQPLEPKSFRLLQFLIENRDRVVSKQEIFDAVWAGTFVTDNALTRVIAQIRKALGDDSKDSRYIETIPTIGYRFVAAIREVPHEQVRLVSPEPPAAPAATPLAPLAAPAAPRTGRPGLAVAAIAVLAAAAFGVWMFRSPGPPAAVSAATEALKPVQFSSSAGLDMGPSFSPDGALVAYASDKSGSFEIYVRSFDTGARELQLTNDGHQNIDPAFSPDGRWVAFDSVRRRGIFIVPATGGTARRVADFGVHPVWSPDSQTLVFRSSGSASLSTTDYYWPAESTLWTVTTAGGDAKPLLDANVTPPGGQSFPSFSPDGSEVRFVNDDRGEASVWVYRLGDARPRKLFGSKEFPYSDATFARDGSRMWFVSWELNGDIAIWQVRLDPKTLMPQGDPEPFYPSPFAAPRDLALSADGSRLAFTAVRSDSAIMALKLSDKTSTQLTSDQLYRFGLVRSSPAGDRVVYNAFPRNGLTSSRISALDGSPPVTPVTARFQHTYSSLSADNSHVFFSEKRDDGSFLMSQQISDGARKEHSRLPDGASQLVWSRDGSRVLYHNTLEGRRQVYMQDTATGARRVIASGDEDYGFPRFSRDEQWISVEITHRPRGGDDIGVMPASGGPIEIILKSDQPSYAAGWMADNDRILFAGFRDSTWNLYTVSRTTRRVERLTSFASMRTYVRYPDWMVGDRVVYEFNESKGNIFVADLKR